MTSEAADLHRWLRRKIDEDAVSTSAAAFAPAIVAQSWAQVRTTLQDMA